MSVYIKNIFFLHRCTFIADDIYVSFIKCPKKDLQISWYTKILNFNYCFYL